MIYDDYCIRPLKVKGLGLWTISPAAIVYEALLVLSEKNIGALPVLEADGWPASFPNAIMRANWSSRGSFRRTPG